LTSHHFQRPTVSFSEGLTIVWGNSLSEGLRVYPPFLSLN
jgi:hypothetical protein